MRASILLPAIAFAAQYLMHGEAEAEPKCAYDAPANCVRTILESTDATAVTDAAKVIKDSPRAAKQEALSSARMEARTRKTAHDGAIATRKEKAKAVEEAEESAAATPTDDALKEAVVQAKAALESAEKDESEREKASKFAADLVAVLEKLDNADREGRTEAFLDAAHGCGDALTYCVDRFGDELVPEEIIPTLNAGNTLSIKVFTHVESDKEEDFVVEFESISGAEVLIGNAETPKTTGFEALDASKRVSVSYVLRRTAKTSAVAAGTELVRAEIRRSNDGGSSRTVSFSVNKRMFHVEIGVTGAFILGGERRVLPPGVIETDVDVTGAFGFTWFFVPRTKGQFRYEFKRSLGLTLSTDFNFTLDPRDKDWFVGLTSSPVQGVGFSLGLGLVHGEFRRSGAVLPDVTADMGLGEEHFMVRPYAGVVLTPEFIGALLSASNRARSLFAPAQSNAEKPNDE